MQSLAFWLEPHDMVREGKKHKWRAVSGGIKQRSCTLLHSAEGGERQQTGLRRQRQRCVGTFQGQASDCPLASAVGVHMTLRGARSDWPHFGRHHHKMPRGQTMSSFITNPGIPKRGMCEVKVSVAQLGLTVTPWTVTRQAPQSLEFSRQEYWSGLAIPFSRDLPDLGIEPRSPTLQADSLLSEPPRKPR